MSYGKAWLCALSLALGGLASQAIEAEPPQAKNASLASPPVEEVTITARVLDRVVIPEFVRLHAIPSPKTNQISRWRDAICPTTQGLQPLSNELVSRRIVSLARSVGAPTQRSGECKTNVEILFTADPRTQLGYVATKESSLLGMPAGDQKDLTAFDHPIRAWYETQTRSLAVVDTPYFGMGPGGHPDHTSSDPYLTGLWQGRGTPMGSPGVQIDSENSLIRGAAGSHLGARVASEFANVLIIVDTNQMRGFPLKLVADYVAILVLTRASLGGCTELPSVTDLLSPECHTKPRPEGVTRADMAYLTALYTSDPEANLTNQQGELHDRMLTQITGR
jgi:hypothetical protein